MYQSVYQRSSAIALLVAVLVAGTILVASPAPLDAQSSRPVKTNPFRAAIAGVWEGDLDFAAIGNPRVEPLTLSLSTTGVAILISEHEPTEIESATIGIWENQGKGWIEVGVQAHRLGDGACAIIAPPDGSAADDCVLRIHALLRSAGEGLLTGEVTLIFREVDATTGEVVEVVTPPLSAEFRKLDMDDFRR